MKELTTSQKETLQKLGYAVETGEDARKALADAFGYEYIPQKDIDDAIATFGMVGYLHGIEGCGYRTGELMNDFNRYYSYRTELSQSYGRAYWQGFELQKYFQYLLVKTA